MASFSSRARTLLSKLQLPEKWKGGRLERIHDYFRAIGRDYKAAVEDTVQDMKEAPRKAAVYLSLLGAGTFLAKTSPSFNSFQEQLLCNHHDLLLLGDRIRNRISDDHMHFLMMHHREGTLRYTNCFFFSLVWLAAADPNVDLLEKKCALVQPRWKDFHKQVVDVGVLGRWLRLNKAMVDYDINVDEWDEQGHKRQAVSVRQ